VPNVTLRDVTERPETIEAGSNILAGCEPEMILTAVKLVLEQEAKWEAPSKYLRRNVSETVVKIVAGFHFGDRQAQISPSAGQIRLTATPKLRG
jgi:UDP-N-acetylglucosamine 2-epimerase (non-hydrolysing)